MQLPITVGRACLRYAYIGPKSYACPETTQPNVTSDRPLTMLFLMEFRVQPGGGVKACWRQISAASSVHLAIRSRSSARVRSRSHRGKCVVLAGVAEMAGRRDGEMAMVLEGG